MRCAGSGNERRIGYEVVVGTFDPLVRGARPEWAPSVRARSGAYRRPSLQSRGDVAVIHWGSKTVGCLEIHVCCYDAHVTIGWIWVEWVWHRLAVEHSIESRLPIEESLDDRRC